jgi:NitT/TauT family transport system substrate-binding protein
MDNPPDRVTYGDLRLVRFEFDAVMRLAAEAGVLPRPIPYERYTDERFMRAFTPKTIRVSADDAK